MLEKVLQAEKIISDKNSNSHKKIRKTGNENVKVTIKDFFHNYYLFKT